MHSAWYVALGAAAGAATVLVISTWRETHVQQVASPQESVSADEPLTNARVQRVHAGEQLQRTARILHSAEAPTAEPAPGSKALVDVPLTESELTEEEMSARHTRLVAARAQAVGAVLQNEVRDSRWADEMETSIAVWAKDRVGTIEDVECRATLCRLTMLHESLDDRREFQHQLRVPVPGFHRIFGSPESGAEHGGYRMTLYLVRPGHKLPGPRRYEEISLAE